MALPGRPGQPVQIVDGRDLGRLLSLVERGQPGVFNSVGPADSITLSDLAHACAAVGGAELSLETIDPSELHGPFPLV